MIRVNVRPCPKKFPRKKEKERQTAVNLFDWHDKIVHLLEGMYEEAFFGFSCGFRRPGRVQHDVLDICSVGLPNWCFCFSSIGTAYVPVGALVFLSSRTANVSVDALVFFS
jgi:hypothetical protein